MLRERSHPDDHGPEDRRGRHSPTAYPRLGRGGSGRLGGGPGHGGSCDGRWAGILESREASLTVVWIWGEEDLDWEILDGSSGCGCPRVCWRLG